MQRSLLGLDSADLIRFIIFVLFLLHWSACIFYFLDSQLCADSEDRSTYVANDMDMLPFMDKYVASFYWAFATVLTIGYGDVSAQCTATRVFSLFTMLVGSVGYAYGISMVMGMMQKRREQNREFKELMSSVEDYAHFRHLPMALKEDVREYFTFVNARNEFINEKIILDQLTPELRKHVLHHVNSELIQSVDFFRELQLFENSLDIQPKNLLIDIIAALQTRVLRPGEVVIREGEVHDALYLITKGQVSSYKWGRLKLDTFGDGSSFGEACFLSRSLKRKGEGVNYRFSMSHVEMEKVLRMSAQADEKDFAEDGAHSQRSLSKQASEESSSGAPSGSPSAEVVYSQPYTIIATTYSDVRYISRDDFDSILKKCLRQKRIKIVEFMRKRCEKLLVETAEYEDDLRNRFPDAWLGYLHEITKLTGDIDGPDDPDRSRTPVEKIDKKSFFRSFRSRNNTISGALGQSNSTMIPEESAKGNVKSLWKDSFPRASWSSSPAAGDVNVDSADIDTAGNIPGSPDPFTQSPRQTPVVESPSMSQTYNVELNTLNNPNGRTRLPPRRPRARQSVGAKLPSDTLHNGQDQCSDICDVMEREGLIGRSSRSFSMTSLHHALPRGSFKSLDQFRLNISPSVYDEQSMGATKQVSDVEDYDDGGEAVEIWRRHKLDSAISEGEELGGSPDRSDRDLPIFLEIDASAAPEITFDGVNLTPKSRRPKKSTGVFESVPPRDQNLSEDRSAQDAINFGNVVKPEETTEL